MSARWWSILQLLGGVAALVGVYLAFGLAVALMLGGSSVLAGAVTVEVLANRPPAAAPTELDQRRGRAA